ncbi:hypothetical protein [Maritalea sp.]|uniref:hypothetical protein n=1 Tax=Maritalea sp. TaxID=2003361 RepID=UPI003F4A906B
MFGTARNKTNLLPLAIVLAAVSGVFLAESGVKFSTPAIASNILDVASSAKSTPAGSLDLENLVKIDGRMFNVTVDDSVDLNPMSSTMVKKISGGRVFNVNIATTSTGTYSTDSMQSKHVLYPGMTVERVHPVLFADNGLVYLTKKQARNLSTFFKDLDGFANDSAAKGCQSLGSYLGCK